MYKIQLQYFPPTCKMKIVKVRYLASAFDTILVDILALQLLYWKHGALFNLKRVYKKWE